jgi:hypothetical protein
MALHETVAEIAVILVDASAVGVGQPDVQGAVVNVAIAE